MRNKLADDHELFEDEREASEPTGEELPPITTLKIDCTDKRGIHYQGAFVFKVPTMKDEIEIGRRKSLLLPVSVVNDTNAIMLAEMIAYLDVTIQKGDKGERLPKWWKPLEFYDVTPIVALYSEATAYARRFRGEPDSNASADAREASDEHSAPDRSDVDGDLQAPVERRTVHRTDSARSASASAARRGAQGGEG
jgi:hypothetical protein